MHLIQGGMSTRVLLFPHTSRFNMRERAERTQHPPDPRYWHGCTTTRLALSGSAAQNMQQMRALQHDCDQYGICFCAVRQDDHGDIHSVRYDGVFLGRLHSMTSVLLNLSDLDWPPPVPTEE